MTSTALAIPYQSTDIHVLTDAQGETWFAANDVAQVLHVSNIRASLRRLDEDEKRMHFVETSGGKQSVMMVSEAGLYTLILRSRRPEAAPFRRWVTHEVLPSIRKHGHYLPQQTQLPHRPKDWALIIANGIDDEGQSFTRELLYATPDDLGYTSLRSKGGKHCHTVSFDGPGRIDTFHLATAVPEHLIAQATPYALTRARERDGREGGAFALLGLISEGAVVSPWRVY